MRGYLLRGILDLLAHSHAIISESPVVPGLQGPREVTVRTGLGQFSARSRTRCLPTDIVAFRGVERVPPSTDIVPFGARRSEGCLDHGGHGKIGSTPKRDGKAKTGTPPACRIDIKLARGMIA